MSTKDLKTQVLLLIVGSLLAAVVAVSGWTLRTVITLDKSVVAIQQHLVDQGWRPVAVTRGTKTEKEAGPVPAKAVK